MKQLICLLLIALSPAAVIAEERILDFHSDVTVNPDSTMTVRETIKVSAEGRNIRQGIYREIPTDYRDRFNNGVRVGLKVMEVRRDHAPEGWHTERRGNGLRIYMGRKGVFLEPGEYTYTLIYHTTRQLGFFPNHDELYWNVSGTDWAFPADSIGATVHLPEEVPLGEVTMEAYTGRHGESGDDYRAFLEDGAANFQTTRTLRPGETLTIVVGWPKGHVHEPTTSEKLGWFFRDNRAAFIALLGLVAVTLYYLYFWHRVGRDPETGVIFPRYKAPEGLSPASVRYIERMGYDNRAFAGAIVNLAVKGYVRIIEDDDDEFTIERTDVENVEMAPGEKALIKRLLGGRKRIKLEQGNHSKIRKARDAHEEALSADYEKKYFVTNSGYMFLGIVLSLVALGISVLALPGGEERIVTIFISVWLAGWTVGLLVLLKFTKLRWRAAKSGIGLGRAIFITLFMIPFLGFELVGLTVLVMTGSWVVGITMALLVTINFLFYQLLKAPTLAGRRLLDKIEGFREYLAVAEKDELKLKHPPEKTPELFEAFLPYAIALDVEDSWAKRFAAVLAAAQLEREGGYHPGWYSGRSFSANRVSSFSSAMGSSLSSAIASSSSPPGTSSGGGGGGFSGGGGGGGGGGGW